MAVLGSPGGLILAVIGAVQGFFFLPSVVLLAGPLASHASSSWPGKEGHRYRPVVHVLAVLFLAAAFFAVAQAWIDWFARGDVSTRADLGRAWGLLWFVGMLGYLVSGAIARNRGRQ